MMQQAMGSMANGQAPAAPGAPGPGRRVWPAIAVNGLNQMMQQIFSGGDRWWPKDGGRVAQRGHHAFVERAVADPLFSPSRHPPETIFAGGQLSKLGMDLPIGDVLDVPSHSNL